MPHQATLSANPSQLPRPARPTRRKERIATETQKNTEVSVLATAVAARLFFLRVKPHDNCAPTQLRSSSQRIRSSLCFLCLCGNPFLFLSVLPVLVARSGWMFEMLARRRDPKRIEGLPLRTADTRRVRSEDRLRR